MTVEIRPATVDRFADVAAVLGPRNADATVGWGLSHRLDSRTNRELRGRDRGAYVEELCRRRSRRACSPTTATPWQGSRAWVMRLDLR